MQSTLHNPATTPAMPAGASSTQQRFVFKAHNQPDSLKRDREAMEQLMNQPPQKTIACQRCRKLRKKCSKHYPHCVTCMKMGHECVYADKDDNMIRSGSVHEQHLYNTNKNSSSSLIDTLPKPKLPPLKGDWSFTGNYTHRSTDMDRAPSLPSIIPPSTETRLPSIKLPSISASQLQNIPMEHKPLPQLRKHSLQGPTEIQSALLSTIISLGKDNLQPSHSGRPLMLPRDVAAKCVESFFAQTESMYPFVHKQHFLSKFDKMNLFNVLNPSTSLGEREKKGCFQTYLILCIGFHGLQEKTTGLTKEEVQTHSWVFSSESISEWLKRGTLDLRSYDDIVCMVLLVLDSFHQKNCLATTNLTNILTGLIMRYHYHRKLGSLETQKVYKGDHWALEMRHRLFWTVYILDRTVATYLNKPIAIPNTMVSTPLPKETSQDPDGFATAFTLLIDLKRIEGDIHDQVHSVTAINTHSAQHNEETVLQPLRLRVEQWYLNTTALPKSGSSAPLWLTSMYYNALMMIYRPSYRVPKPSQEMYARLARAVTQNLTYSYNLSVGGTGEVMHWFALFKDLVVFKTLLRCFVQGSLSVRDSRTELSLCVEITKSYRGMGQEWGFLDEIALVFQRLLKMAFDAAEESVLVGEAKYAEERLEMVLLENSIGCRLDDRIEEEYGA